VCFVREEVAMKFTPEDRISINHDLLYSLMTYGDDAESLGKHAPYRIGNWNSWGLAPRGILTWLVSQALNVHRLPWHPDVCQATRPYGAEEEETFRLFSEQFDSHEKVQAAVAEIRRIYDFTQDVFRRQGRSTITLKRSLADGAQGSDTEGYASRIAGCAKAAKFLGRRSFDMPSNILTSWSGGGYYGGYPVTITIEHPVENIVWCSGVIASRSNNPRGAAVEDGEWVIVDRSLTGLISIPVDAVSITAGAENRLESIYLAKERTWYATDESEQQRAERYLKSQYERLEPLNGYTLPHHHPAKLNLSWRQRIGLAWQVYQRLSGK